MSTAGSAPSSSDAAAAAAGALPRRRLPIFRWRAIGALILAAALIALLYTLFLDRIVESTVEEGATKLLGTAVQVDGLRIHTFDPSVDVGAVQIADPFDRMRNLVEAGTIRVSLARDPLLERKIVVQRLEVRDLRFGTRRTKPAPRVSHAGFAPRALTALQQWAAQYKKPLLSFTPVDTIRAIVLDPTQLTTVRTATALAARADSVKGATEGGLRELRVQETLDSAQAVVERLRDATPAKLGLDGTRRAVADVKRTIDAVNAAKQRVDALAQSARAGATLLAAGVGDLDAARQRDYAFARSLLKLPSLEGPEISTALFGQVSIDRVQQALYWASLAREYLPPGLLPREEPGPKRLRRAGSTVRFPKEHAYPSFAIQRGDLSVEIPTPGGHAATYVAQVTDLSSAPALTGRPTRFAVRPTARPTGAITLSASGTLDHRRSVVHDRAAATVGGVPLPAFDLPVLPVRVDPGRGITQLRIALDGDRVDAVWTIKSNDVRWLADSAKLRTLDAAQALIYRVLAGLPSLDLTAHATGPLLSPSLSVSSNLDRAIGDRLRAVAGEEIAKGEARARAAVDSVVAAKAAPARAKAVAVQREVQQRVDDARKALDERKQQLEAELKSLTGLSGLLRPGV